MTHPIYKSFVVDSVKYVLDSNRAGSLVGAFTWAKSDEGWDYWSGVMAGKTLTDEAREKLQGYLDKRPGLPGLSLFRRFLTWLKKLI